jgi:hypothetical protein
VLGPVSVFSSIFLPVTSCSVGDLNCGGFGHGCAWVGWAWM